MGVDEPGEDALKLGVLFPDAGFVVFKDNQSGLPYHGVALIYYSRQKESLVLDNIEINNGYIKETLLKDVEVRKGIWDSIMRFANNVKIDMTAQGFPVKHVTLGTGYCDAFPIINDKKIIKKDIPIIENGAMPQDMESYDSKLSDVYTDADKQWVLPVDEKEYAPLPQILPS